MEEEKHITFDAMPALIQQMTLQQLDMAAQIRKLSEEVASLRAAIVKDPNTVKRMPVDMDRAAEIIGKSKNTLYRYTSQGLIPCYKRGRSIYFFEDELHDWIRRGRIEDVEDTYKDYDSPIVPLNR